MVAESHICTACGYEGKPIRPPSDHAGEEEPFLVGVMNKLFFMTTFIPLKFGWMVRLAQREKAKTCPNCGLPLMVKVTSDAGWLAKRKNDIKAGLFVPPSQRKPEVVFGKDVKLPGDDEKATVEPAPRPEKLPSLTETLAEEEKASEIAPDTLNTEQPIKPKKPVNPDEW